MPTPNAPGSVMVAVGTPTRPTPDFIITSNAQFTNANVNNTAYRVIAVAPGVVAPAALTLSASGTASAPRWLMLNRSDGAHPATLASNLTASVPKIDITGSYWIVDRISVRDAIAPSIIRGTNNRFQFGVFDTRIGTGNGMKLRFEGSGHTIVNSVFRNPLRTPGQDSYALYVTSGSNIRVIGNEFIGMPSSVQIPPGTGGGHIVSSNEFYQDSGGLTACNGTMSPTGNCMCGEGVTFVAKGTGTAQTYVEHNFVWDYPPSDANPCSGTGTEVGLMDLGSGGQQTNNYTLRYNTIVGKITGSGRRNWGIYTGANVAYNTISENFIANVDAGITAAYMDNSTMTNNVYSNNSGNFSTGSGATGNTISPANAGRAAVAGERGVVKYHLTNPTPVSYP